MPVIARLFGVVIKMYFRDSEHNPPHIHAIYGEYSGIFDIETASMTEGDIPSKLLPIIEDWITINRDELLYMWNTQKFYKLDGK